MKDSLLAAIGNTPLVEIRRLNPNPGVRLFAKLEYLNPGGSVKDRPALYMIEAAEKSGELTHDRIVAEATSGNTGIGLALVCAVKGYRLLLAMSEAVSQERRRILKARGAEIRLTPGHLGTDGAIEEIYRLARENPGRYFVVDQFNNAGNWKAHYFGTAEEVWRQTGGRITAFVAAMGTTGTLMGVSRRLKEVNPAVAVIGVEPYLGHKIQGLKNLKEAYCPEIFEKQRLDRKINIADDEAFETARRLAREEGLFVGMSSGAAMAGALQECRRMSAGVLVVILADGGERYLSTPLFAGPEKVRLSVFNRSRRAKEPLEPVQPDCLAVYTCGAHTGRPLSPSEARRFLLSDLLCRYLRWKGFGVKHLVDVPEAEDGRPPAEPFGEGLALLGIRPADVTLRPAEHTEAMIAAARRLADKGYAYEKLRSLYFDLAKAADYGRLSGMDPAGIKTGATVDLESFEKANPRDFALLKRCRLSELKRGAFVKTQWGNVRPAWHLQTTAMVLGELGGPLDLHVSSRELAFPHHENENALALALTGKPFAHCWMHCERTVAPGLTLADIAGAGFSGREIRTWMLSVHYRKPLVYAPARLTEARRALERLDGCLRMLKGPQAGAACPDIDQLVYDLHQALADALADDFNLPAALAGLFRTVKRINRFAAGGLMDAAGAARLRQAFEEVDAVLGVLDSETAGPSAPEVHALLEARAKARAEKNWALADRLRAELIARGAHVQDLKSERPR